MDEQSKGTPTPQDWYDDNRQTFGAGWTSVDIKVDKCPHQGFLVRSLDVPSEVQCSACHAGWYFPLSVKIVDGKLL